MKTQEELNKLKNEFEDLNSKLKELSLDEIKEVVSGTTISLPDGDKFWHSFNPMDIYMNDLKKDKK